MTGIDILMKEHENILAFTDLLRKISMEIIDGGEVPPSLLRECIEFGRNYADKHHHGKEEQILFRIMTENMGPVADKLIKNGMLVEHDLGRLHMAELEKAIDEYEKEPTTENKLDIISNAAGYSALLKRHIAREDEVVYTFAVRDLSEELKKTVDKETDAFEELAREQKTSDRYVTWLYEKINR